MRCFITIFIFITFSIFADGRIADYVIEPLQQFSDESFSESLILLEENIHISIRNRQNDRGGIEHYYQFSAEYTIKNIGYGSTKTMGISVLSDPYIGHPNSLVFLVNGINVAYREIESISSRSIVRNKKWLVVDVDFPPDKPVKILVSYRNGFASISMFLTVINYGIYPDLYPYRGFNEGDAFSKKIWNRRSDTIFSILIENKSDDITWIYSVNAGFPYRNILVNEELFSLFDICFPDGISTLFTYNGNICDIETIFPITVILDVSGTMYLCNVIPCGVAINFDAGGLEDAIYISSDIINPRKIYLLTLKQLRIIRNAFYAQHGYVFRDEMLRSLFSSEGIFGSIANTRNTVFNESLLTDIERINIRTILGVENLRQMDCE